VECAESLRVQAFFDGEVDALTALEIERHVETCDACHTLLQGLGQVRRLLRGEGLVRTPEVLRQRLLRELDRESAVRPAHRSRWDPPLWASSPFWIGLLSGTGGGAVAAALVALFVTALPGKPLLDDLIADHTRSLLSSHLIDVVSTDQHTVKPWFAGRTDVSPVVADFAPRATA
jgi:anti-sigma factor RsiW